jgi:hypothetical protein
MPNLFWHPSVVFRADGFGGHKWWMAQTPFSPKEIQPYTDRYEMPCIHFSDDGIRWHNIANNPIDSLSEEDIAAHNYMSDPHLIYKDGKLECYYRKTTLLNKQLQGGNTLLLRKVSNNGFEWSEAEILADLSKAEDRATWGEQIISQSIIWTGAEYLCWYVDGSYYVKNRGVRMCSSVDGIQWTPYVQCKLIGSNHIPWHIDVQYYDDKYHMLSYTLDVGCVEHFLSSDGVNYDYSQTILGRSNSIWSFYRAGLYRSCFVKFDKGIRVYFSAFDGEHSYIGCLESHDGDNYRTIGHGRNLTFWCSLIVYLTKKIGKKITKLFARK